MEQNYTAQTGGYEANNDTLYDKLSNRYGQRKVDYIIAGCALIFIVFVVIVWKHLKK
jgi:Na+/proline symporter